MCRILIKIEPQTYSMEGELEASLLQNYHLQDRKSRLHDLPKVTQQETEPGKKPGFWVKPIPIILFQLLRPEKGGR